MTNTHKVLYRLHYTDRWVEQANEYSTRKLSRTNARTHPHTHAHTHTTEQAPHRGRGVAVHLVRKPGQGPQEFCQRHLARRQLATTAVVRSEQCCRGVHHHQCIPGRPHTQKRKVKEAIPPCAVKPGITVTKAALAYAEIARKKAGKTFF